jgi:hypothetical protein
MKSVGGSDPIGRDTIFRISSMTKPITAAETMIQAEECKLRLDEPVDRLLPELASRKVLKRLDGRPVLPARMVALLAWNPLPRGRFAGVDVCVSVGRGGKIRTPAALAHQLPARKASARQRRPARGPPYPAGSIARHRGGTRVP